MATGLSVTDKDQGLRIRQMAQGDWPKGTAWNPPKEGP